LAYRFPLPDPDPGVHISAGRCSFATTASRGAPSRTSSRSLLRDPKTPHHLQEPLAAQAERLGHLGPVAAVLVERSQDQALLERVHPLAEPQLLVLSPGRGRAARQIGRSDFPLDENKQPPHLILQLTHAPRP